MGLLILKAGNFVNYSFVCCIFLQLHQQLVRITGIPIQHNDKLSVVLIAFAQQALLWVASEGLGTLITCWTRAGVLTVVVLYV